MGRTALIGVVVEVAPLGSLAAVARGEALDWLDISRWVRLPDGIDASRGVGNDGTSAEAGQLQLVLNNDDAAWTPGKPDALRAALALAAGGLDEFMATFSELLLSDPQLKGMPIRLRHLAATRTYAETAALYPAYPDWAEGQPTYADIAAPVTFWTGTVTAVRPGWTKGVRPVCRVTAADTVPLMARTRLAALPVQAARWAGSCRWLYPLDEPADTCADIIGSDASGATAKPLTKRAIGWPPDGDVLEMGGAGSPGSNATGDETACPLWSGRTDTAGWCLDTGPQPLANMPDIGPFGSGSTIHAMLWPAVEGIGRRRSAFSITGYANQTVTVDIDATNHVRLTVTSGASTWTITDTGQIASGQWTHVAVALTDVGGIDTEAELYVAGALVDNVTTYSLYSIAGRRITVGAGVGLVDPWEGRLANMAGHAEALDANTIAHISGGADGWTGDTTADRFARILRSSGYPIAALPDGVSTMCPQHTAGTYASDALTACAAAEMAPWWITRDGQPTLPPRSSRWDKAAAATIPAIALDQGLEFPSDDTARRTVVTVTRPGGPKVVRRNPIAATDGEFGAGDVELLLASDAQAEAAADYLVSDQFARPVPRSESVAVDVVRTRATVDRFAVCNIDVDDVINVTGLPDSAPWASRGLLVRSVTDRINTTGWLRSFAVVDAPPLLDVFTLNDSELDGTDVLAP